MTILSSLFHLGSQHDHIQNHFKIHSQVGYETPSLSYRRKAVEATASGDFGSTLALLVYQNRNCA